MSNRWRSQNWFATGLRFATKTVALEFVESGCQSNAHFTRPSLARDKRSESPRRSFAPISNSRSLIIGTRYFTFLTPLSYLRLHVSLLNVPFLLQNSCFFFSYALALYEADRSWSFACTLRLVKSNLERENVHIF